MASKPIWPAPVTNASFGSQTCSRRWASYACCTALAAQLIGSANTCRCLSPIGIRTTNWQSST